MQFSSLSFIIQKFILIYKLTLLILQSKWRLQKDIQLNFKMLRLINRYFDKTIPILIVSPSFSKTQSSKVEFESITHKQHYFFVSLHDKDDDKAISSNKHQSQSQKSQNIFQYIQKNGEKNQLNSSYNHQKKEKQVEINSGAQRNNAHLADFAQKTEIKSIGEQPNQALNIKRLQKINSIKDLQTEMQINKAVKSKTRFMALLGVAVILISPLWTYHQFKGLESNLSGLSTENRQKQIVDEYAEKQTKFVIANMSQIV